MDTFYAIDYRMLKKKMCDKRLAVFKWCLKGDPIRSSSSKKELSQLFGF